MKKNLRKIFIILFLFSLSDGIFYNFCDLWMQANNLSIKTIGTVISLCSFVSISVVFLSSNLIKQRNLKKFVTSLFFAKCIISFLLFSMHLTGLNVLIKFLIIVDRAIDNEIIACLYPLICLAEKSDKNYALKVLIYNSAYYLGVLFVGVMLGKTLLGYVINYNTYCILSTFLLGIISLIALSLDFKISKKEEKDAELVISKILRKIKNDKVSCAYLLNLFFGNMSYYSIAGMIILMLVNNFNFTPEISTYINLSMGILSTIIGFIVLLKLTFKNDYLNLSIKYLVRFLLYLLAVIINNKIMFLIALVYCILISSAYSNITDAPYINRFSDEEQLSFSNLREMIKLLGNSIGLFLSGIALEISVRYNFLFAFVFVGIQSIFAFYALYLRKKEVK